jgi:hypothetical protein
LKTPNSKNAKRRSSGDKLVIYTDGVTEAQNSQAEFFARQRLRKLVEAHPADSLPGTAPCGGGRHCRVYGVRAAGRWHHTGGD